MHLLLLGLRLSDIERRTSTCNADLLAEDVISALKEVFYCNEYRIHSQSVLDCREKLNELYMEKQMKDFSRFQLKQNPLEKSN